MQAGGPGVLVAATHSGAGKTTVTTTIASALARRGLDVQPFKLGPDFIDPAYHSEATGRPSINLDLWMMGEHGIRGSYRRWSSEADISVVESMGALFDGVDGTGEGSAADVARILGLPVIVVVDVSGMTRTAAAILDGLRAFDPTTEIAGAILNRVGSAGHAEMVMKGLPQHLRRLVLGAIPSDSELEIAERHLGLVTVEENEKSKPSRSGAQMRAAQWLDLDRIGNIAGAGTRPGGGRHTGEKSTLPVARLAVARDRAFSFYYEENLLRLREAGFELVRFQPTIDPSLPRGTDAVYIGGGYPESFAPELAANESLVAELRERAAGGMPIHAECGGLLYLGRSLTGFDGCKHTMSGLLPIDAAMDRDFLAIGYVEARTRVGSPFGAAGTRARGQEFHQSRIVESDIEPNLYDLTSSDGRSRRDGYLYGSVIASYVHLHFSSNLELVASLLQTAINARA